MKMYRTALLALFTASSLHVFAAETTASDTTPAESTPEAETAPAQNDWTPATTNQKSFRDNLFWGGYINLSLGSYKVIGIEPMLGYRVTPKFSTGVKVRYDYIRDERYATTYTTSTYGGSIFARYYVTPRFYAQIEPAMYNYEFFYIGGGSEREWVPYLLMGGGIKQPINDRTWLNFQILFDVLQDNKSPYDDWTPFFSIGVGVGL